MQSPGGGLWIVRIKISNELCVSEVPQAAAVVGHSIGCAWQVVHLRLVSEVALVEGRKLEEVRGWARGGGAAFGTPRHGRCVVCEGASREVMERHCGSQDVVVGDGTCKFEVAVGDGAPRIVEGDEFLLHDWWELISPKDGPLESVLGSRLDG